MLEGIEQAIKVAKRSSIRTHKTGAVIVLRENIVSNGWSHVPSYSYALKSKRSLHAELHALARGRHEDLSGAICYVATLAGKSGNVCDALPCLDCAIALRAAGISVVFYSTHVSHHWLNLTDERAFRGLKVYERNGS
jgi:deoxycytidylate deaminase